MSDSSPRFLSQSNNKAFKNPWVLGLLAGIILVVSVNVGFIITAFMTTPGLVEEDYYEKGRDIEANVRQKVAARTNLGWHVVLNLPDTIKMGVETTFHLNVVDKSGLPLNEANVTVDFYRPSDANADLSSVVTSFAPGIYQAKVTLPLKGIWEAVVTVKSGDNSYNFRQRFSASAS